MPAGKQNYAIFHLLYAFKYDFLEFSLNSETFQFFWFSFFVASLLDILICFHIDWSY